LSATKVSFQKRLRQIEEMLKEKEEVTAIEVSKRFGVTISWAKRLLKNVAEVLDGVEYSDLHDSLRKVQKEG